MLMEQTTMVMHRSRQEVWNPEKMRIHISWRPRIPKPKIDDIGGDYGGCE
jgi:hypothetical protein